MQRIPRMLRMLRSGRRINCPLKPVFSAKLRLREAAPLCRRPFRGAAQRTALAPLISVSSMRNFLALGWVATATAVS